MFIMCIREYHLFPSFLMVGNNPAWTRTWVTMEHLQLTTSVVIKSADSQILCYDK